MAHHYHTPRRLLKIVAVEPLSGGRTLQALYSTVRSASAEQVLSWYARRWSIECAFHDAKGQLGFEQPQGWTKQPVAMLLYSLIVLWFAREGHRDYAPLPRPWYVGKAHPSFADMLATLRVQSVQEVVLRISGREVLVSKPVQSLIHCLKLAA